MRTTINLPTLPIQNPTFSLRYCLLSSVNKYTQMFLKGKKRYPQNIFEYSKHIYHLFHIRWKLLLEVVFISTFFAI